MTYSLDLMLLVITYLEIVSSITKAAKILGIGRATRYRRLNRQNREPTKVKRRQRKLDW